MTSKGAGLLVPVTPNSGFGRRWCLPGGQFLLRINRLPAASLKFVIPEMDSEIKEEIPVHEEFILCCGVETQVLKCGPWTDLINNQSGTRPKLLIFIIPGNPGFSPLYVPFAKALYSTTKRRFPVWIISHAGHALAPRGKKVLKSSEDPNAEEIKDIYGLHGQVEHKLAFLRTQVPKEMKLVVIGHSIGSYFSLEILKHAPELPVIHSILLFPTIERISESPKGKFATPLLCWLRYALYVPCYLLLKPWPEKIKSLMTRMVLQMMDIPREFLCLNMFEPFCLVNAAYLGSQEMREVVKRDNETIKEHLPKPPPAGEKRHPWAPPSLGGVELEGWAVPGTTYDL
uniref:Lipid droplet associated hydrolase n=2 Tax=Ovis aries TaxID=9940 RepID=A0AC11C3T6_SHEEP